MIPQTLSRSDMIPAAVGTGALLALSALLLLSWLALGWWLGKRRAGRIKSAALMLPPATAFVWTALQAAARAVQLATSLGLFELSLIAGSALTLTWLFYRHEVRIAGRRAHWLLGLRLAAVAALCAMLAEPTATGWRERKIPRRVVVLFDDSASMRTVDALWSPTERASVAEALGIAAAPAGMWTNGTEAAEAFVGGLPPEAAARLAEALALPRGELAGRIFRHGRGSADCVKLADRFAVECFRFASCALPDPLALKGGGSASAESGGASRDDAFRAVTDMAGALETVAEKIPPEEIAAVIVFTDGRHNGSSGVEAISRRLGVAGVKIHSVIVGSAVERRDAAVAGFNVRESVFLGDRVRMTVGVSVRGFAGKTVKLKLWRNDRMLEERQLEVDCENWRKELKFQDEPSERGLYRYRAELERLDGDACAENDAWSRDVSVSDDRVNVLLAEKRPRWEYRYLRNLFYGRDKSVHLQDLLLEPDRLPGDTQPRPAASAGRKFGDSESGAFPANDAEWAKFDVIILGDLGADDLPPEAAESIRRSVTDRGALLVLIGGPEAMPHRLAGSKVAGLCPVEVEPRPGYFTPPEDSFKFALTAAGRGHPAMKQSDSAAESEAVWDDLPEFGWRLPLSGVKAGAEVLAVAHTDGGMVDFRALMNEAAKTPEAAVQRIETMRKLEQRRALAVAKQEGRGKVLMLATDMMWRLRYRVGDARHHQFWGQVLKWGAGERLRAGNDAFRFGTDAVCYAPGSPVRICARAANLTPEEAALFEPEATVLSADGKRLTTVALKYREDSNGFYSAEIQGPAEPGGYIVEFAGGALAWRLGEAMPKETSTRFAVQAARTPAEFTEVSASRDACARMAAATGGKVMSPHEYANAELSLGEGTKIVREVRENELWAHPLAFLLLLSLLSAEWILRKRMGLS